MASASATSARACVVMSAMGTATRSEATSFVLIRDGDIASVRQAARPTPAISAFHTHRVHATTPMRVRRSSARYAPFAFARSFASRDVMQSPVGLAHDFDELLRLHGDDGLVVPANLGGESERRATVGIERRIETETPVTV